MHFATGIFFFCSTFFFRWYLKQYSKPRPEINILIEILFILDPHIHSFSFANVHKKKTTHLTLIWESWGQYNFNHGLSWKLYFSQMRQYVFCFNYQAPKLRTLNKGVQNGFIVQPASWTCWWHGHFILRTVYREQIKQFYCTTRPRDFWVPLTRKFFGAVWLTRPHRAPDILLGRYPFELYQPAIRYRVGMTLPALLALWINAGACRHTFCNSVRIRLFMKLGLNSSKEARRRKNVSVCSLSR